MNQDVEVRQRPEPVSVFKAQVAKNSQEFHAALPAHLPVERFTRVVVTAVVNNPNLLDADRRSLLEAAIKAAQDGLLPDGREGALVIFGKKVQWMPMIAGILKKVRNSGELLSIAAHVAYSNDEFTYELGDDEKIKHRPALEARGKPRLVYAIAKTKDGGTYREIMTVGDVERVRAVSRAANSGPWVTWWDEMARKTVLRRLAKRLPMSSDLDDLIRRDDSLSDFETPQVGRPARAKTLTGKLDALAAGGETREPTQDDGLWIKPTPDPETGEIIDPVDEAPFNKQNDPTGEKAGARLAERLDERAAKTSMYDQEKAKLEEGKA